MNGEKGSCNHCTRGSGLEQVEPLKFCDSNPKNMYLHDNPNYVQCLHTA
jgi:hypothetical protein